MTLLLLVALKTNTIVSCFLAVILGVTFAILGRPKKTKKAETSYIYDESSSHLNFLGWSVTNFKSFEDLSILNSPMNFESYIAVSMTPFEKNFLQQLNQIEFSITLR